MPGVAIHLDRAPHSAFLLAWGRAPDAWLGFVQFQQRVHGKHGGISELPGMGAGHIVDENRLGDRRSRSAGAFAGRA